MDWFEVRGCRLVIEDQGRVFPRSGKAQEVRDLLEGEARRLGVQVRARAPVTGITRVEAGTNKVKP